MELLQSVIEGSTERVRQALASGADVDAADAMGKTGLMIAAIRGHSEIADVLIRGGANVNARDARGNTALIYAIYYTQLAPSSRWVAIAKALLAAGADPRIPGGYKGMTAEDWAKELRRNDTLDSIGAAK